jgi:hypothetical protein
MLRTTGLRQNRAQRLYASWVEQTHSRWKITRLRACNVGREHKSKVQQARDKRGGSQYFVAMPDEILRSWNFATLSAHATKLLMDLLSQYNRNNNGDLSIAWPLMEKRGWKSKDTLSKARHELVKRGWLVVTRKSEHRITQLYALTFYSIDLCKGKLDHPYMKGTASPLGAWRIHEPMPDLRPTKMPKSPEIRDIYIGDYANEKRNVQYANRTKDAVISTPAVLRDEGSNA